MASQGAARHTWSAWAHPRLFKHGQHHPALRTLAAVQRLFSRFNLLLGVLVSLSRRRT